MGAELLAELAAIVGHRQVVPGDRVGPTPWETHQPFHGVALVRPADTAEVSRVLATCSRAGQPVVPMGGLTNLVQGCATTAADLGLSLERLNRVEEVDPVAQTMTVQAGVTLRAAQLAADAEGLFFPVDIGARENCMLGGNVSTNAGGTKVIRYGMIRDSVLGLEAVLADGTVISSMNRFIKNNSGFDLKHLFIGTEGTLGVITRLVFRLSVKPRSHNVALLACRRFEDVVQLLGMARNLLGSSLCGFEVMWDSFYRRATQPLGPQRSPLQETHPLYAIVESMGNDAARDDAAFADALEEMIESGLVTDGVVAKSDRERDGIWAIRHEVEWIVSGAFNFDVSLRTADVGAYVADIEARISEDVPGAYVAAFGHLGDNNIHVSVLGNDVRTAHSEIVQKHVYEALLPYAGAISAEHGIGLEKRPWLPISRSAAEIELMRTLKSTLDPGNILNPGKVIDVAGD
ncbi:MAG: FAD-binding oxidoreductase [Gammaproteobacteria bacterium]|nr:FAD-binding oxidoreductase [Gammaproteobacteria bacterium]MDH4254774.1 FAD-binding oxidoreductase [Gammaproteobacteria bacterium]